MRVWGWVGGWGGVGWVGWVGGVGVEEDTGVAACLTRAALAAVFFTVAFFLAAPIFGFPFTFFSMATILLYFPCRPQAPPKPVVPKLCSLVVPKRRLGMRPAKRRFASKSRAGRGLHPRPERSTPAKAGRWRTENKLLSSRNFPSRQRRKMHALA